MPQKDAWKKFIDATKNRQPNGFLQRAILTINRKGGRALDLGCGAGVDARYMAEQGFSVDAVDNNSDALAAAKFLGENLKINTFEEDMAKFVINENEYDLIFSWNSLPFISKDSARAVLMNIQHGLKKNGLFIFQVFGPEDQWHTREDMSFFTVEEIKDILSQVQFKYLFELKEVGPLAAGGEKFWHLIKGIAQRK